MSDLFYIRVGQDPRLVQWGQPQPGASPAQVDSVQIGNLEQAVAGIRTLGKNPQVVLMLPAADIVLNHVNLPIRQQGRLLQAVPYALEDQLAEDVEKLHFAIGDRLADGNVPVASVARTTMSEQLQALQDLGIQPIAVVPETLCLPAVKAEDGWQVLIDGRNCVVRTAPYDGFSCDVAELADFLLMAQGNTEHPEGLRLNLYQASGSALPPLEGVSAEIRKLAVRAGLACLMPATLSGNINLLQGEFASEPVFDRWWRPLRATAVLFLTWVLLGTAHDAVQHVRLASQLEALETENLNRFQQMFPQVSRIVDMRAQGEQQLSLLRQDGAAAGLFPLLGATAQALRKVEGLQVQELQMRDGLLYMSMTAVDIQALENLKAHFSTQKSWELEVQSANAGSEGVQIRASLKGSTV